MTNLLANNYDHKMSDIQREMDLVRHVSYEDMDAAAEREAQQRDMERALIAQAQELEGHAFDEQADGFDNIAASELSTDARTTSLATYADHAGAIEYSGDERTFEATGNHALDEQGNDAHAIERIIENDSSSNEQPT